jgi:hypothetical protein
LSIHSSTVRQRNCRELTECFGSSGVVGDSEYRRTSGYCEENVVSADEGRKALFYRVRNGAPVFELYFCVERPSAPVEECRHLTKTAPWREIRLTVSSEYGKRYPIGAYELTSEASQICQQISTGYLLCTNTTNEHRYAKHESK